MEENGDVPKDRYSVNTVKSEAKTMADGDDHPMFKGTHEDLLAEKKASGAERFVDIFFWVAVLATVALISIVIASIVLQSKTGKLNAITMSSETFVLKDGTLLSGMVTRPFKPHVKYPVVFEMSDKRKDDAHSEDDWRVARSLAQRGLVVVQIDARGTGASSGQRPSYPYTQQLVSDAVEIASLLTTSFSYGNGKVGIFGLGSSATLALLAAQQTPKIGAVLALHASQDTFWNDVYPDGNLQFDLYRTLLEEQLATIPPPGSYDYSTSSYFSERFNITANKPSIFTYLQHQFYDGFWSSSSLDASPNPIPVPVYLIGGIYNYHKDFTLDLYKRLYTTSPKVKVVLGPYDFSWPDDTQLGPQFNALQDVASWFKQWLSDEDNGFLREPDVAMFYRHAFTPRNVTTTSNSNLFSTTASSSPSHTTYPFIMNGPSGMNGDWRFEGWPILRTAPLKFQTSSSGAPSHLDYDPTTGYELGMGWGPLTGNMANLDTRSTSFTTQALTNDVAVNGFPSFSLRVYFNDSAVNWNIRLEDVAPTGEVALITGCSINGAMTPASPEPKAPTPGWITLTGSMHYTTWIVPKGHQLRISVSNSAPGMQWASPLPLQTIIDFADASSFFEIPSIPEPIGRTVRVPKFTGIAPDAPTDSSLGFPYNRSLSLNTIVRPNTNTLTWHQSSGKYTNANNALFVGFTGRTIETQSDQPDVMRWEGKATHIIITGVQSTTKDDPPGEPGIYLHTLLDSLQQNYSYSESPQSTVTTNTAPRALPIPNLALNSHNWIRVDTSTVVTSDQSNFFVTCTRALTGTLGTLPHQSITATFPRQGH